MVEIRTMVDSDFNAVAAFAEEGLQPKRYPLVYSRVKLRGMVQHFLNSRTDYHRIAVDDGRVVGVLAAVMTEMPFFQRCEAHVCAFYATKVGVGRELLAGLLDWMDDHFMVQRLCWMHNPGMRPSVHRLARMCGNGRQMQTMDMTIFYKG